MANSRYAVTADMPVYGLPSAIIDRLDPTSIQDSLDSASDEADSYLVSRFNLPLTSFGTDLTKAVCKIAAYDLVSVLGFNPEAGADANLRDRANDARKWLQDVAAGRATPQEITDQSIDGPAGTDPSPAILQSYYQDTTCTIGGRSPAKARGW